MIVYINIYCLHNYLIYSEIVKKYIFECGLKKLSNPCQATSNTRRIFEKHSNLKLAEMSKR
jgi:hypothetical protein